MQKTRQTQQKAWKNKAIRKAEVISDTFEVFKIWLGHIANWVLFFCLIFNIIQTVASIDTVIAGSVLIIQCVMLDVAGTSLYSMSKHAKSQSNEEGAKLAMVMSIILLSVMTITALSATASVMFPQFSSKIQIIDHVLVFIRIAIVVAYGFVVHQITTLSEMHDNRIEELEEALRAKEEELNVLTVNLNGQLNALQQQLNGKVNEVNTLRVKVNGQEEDLNALGVKLSSKDDQLASVKVAHEGSLGAIQEAQSSVKAQLGEAHAEVESLRSQLLSVQGSLQAEKQKALSLTAENKDLNAQLNALRVKVNGQTEELNALQVKLSSKGSQLASVKVNAQEKDLNAQLNAPTDDLDSHKIVQLDTQTETSQNYEPRIRSLLTNEPGLSGGEIARRLGCSKPTACYWKKQIEKEAKDEQAV